MGHGRGCVYKLTNHRARLMTASIAQYNLFIGRSNNELFSKCKALESECHIRESWLCPRPYIKWWPSVCRVETSVDCAVLALCFLLLT